MMPFKFHRVVSELAEDDEQQQQRQQEEGQAVRRSGEVASSQQPLAPPSTTTTTTTAQQLLLQRDSSALHDASHSVAKRVGVKPTIIQQFLLGSISSGTATCLSAPMDLIKARLQLQKRAVLASAAMATSATTTASDYVAAATTAASSSATSSRSSQARNASGAGAGITTAATQSQSPSQQREAPPASAAQPRRVTRYKGMLHAGVTITREEGVLALWTGLGAAMWRALTYSGVRLGCYEPIRDLYSQLLERRADAADTTAVSPAVPASALHVKLLAGMTSGALGALVGTPFEVTKVRFQSGKYAYSGTFDALRSTAREEGVRALWNGWQATVARAAMLTATQVGLYDAVKAKVVQVARWEERDPRAFFAAAMLAGLFSTTASSAFDVVKTTQQGARRGAYRGMVHCALVVWRSEGPTAFFKGWVPSYVRLGPHTLVTLWVYETVRKALGFTSL